MRLLFIGCAVMLSLGLRAQAYPDTIVTNKGVVFACRVLHVDQFYVYYKPALLDKRTKKGRVLKRDVSSLALYSEVPVEGELPQRDPYIGKYFEWTEHDGIIYANLHDGAPRFGQGQVTINTLLEKHVRVTSLDRQLFWDAAVTMLLKLWIDERGVLQKVKVDEYATANGAQGTQTHYIEEEIMSVVSQFQPWRPATTNGRNVPCMIYLPLKFTVDMNSIVMLPSKYVYTFKGRQQ